MVKEKEVEVVVIPPEHLRDEDFVMPRANWMFIDACGNTVLLKHPDKVKAQEKIDSEYGKGKYAIRATKEKKPKGEIGAKGYVSSKSRAGSNYLNICAKQGRF